MLGGGSLAYVLSLYIYWMAALNENALGKYKGDLFIREVGSSTWINQWAVRALVWSIDGTNITEITSDNRGTLVKFVDLQASVSVTLLESFDRDKLSLLYNTTNTDVAGTPVSVTDEAHGTWLTAGDIIVLNNKNGDNTKVASIVVKDGGSTVLSTDYVSTVTSDGNTQIVLLVDVTGACTVDYTYTPNVSEQAVVNIGTNELKNFEVKIEAITDTAQARTITLSSATLNSTYSMSFVDIIEAGDITGAELTFDGNKWSTLTYYDEVL